MWGILFTGRGGEIDSEAKEKSTLLGWQWMAWGWVVYQMGLFKLAFASCGL
jgi:hypothetical protein